MDKNNNGLHDKYEAYISYFIALVGLTMSVVAFFHYQEFQVSKNFFYVAVLLAGVRDGVDGLKAFLKK